MSMSPVTEEPSSPSIFQSGENPFTAVSVTNSETWEKNKKYTVYKVVITSGENTWFVFRRYNEFSKLLELLKKQHPSLHMKLPGKRFFGNNFSSDFIRTRRQGLNDFVQKLLSNPLLQNHAEVLEFLNVKRQVDNSVSGSTEDESFDPESPETPGEMSDSPDVNFDSKVVDLGPTEKKHAKPSDFEFLKVIGKGSFGKVLLAKHKSEETIHAVKVLQKKMILKRNETTHIMCERNVLLKNLNHPFLVGLHYSFQTKDKLYFVLDYINGGELFFHLQKERVFSETRARFYAAEIASALGYLHSNSIIYRDLKPENLLLDSDGHIVLTDFGLCKDGLEGNDAKTNTFCGTPEYLAPEVLQKKPYDKAVDWWCLGAVLYEMLYGLPPFYSRDTSEMYDAILNKPLKLRSTVSLAARYLLERLLDKEPNKRLGYTNDVEEIKAHDFFKAINWHDLETKAISPPFNPGVRGSLDVKNIDPEFTKEPVPASVGKSQGMSASVQDPDCAFEGFSYAPPMDFNCL